MCYERTAKLMLRLSEGYYNVFHEGFQSPAALKHALAYHIFIHRRCLVFEYRAKVFRISS